MSPNDRDTIARAFGEAVNMPPADLLKWLADQRSEQVGWPKDRDGGESVGHDSGRRILDIKAKKKADLDDDDYDHMRKVVGYVHRHLAQRPNGDVSETKWRYSLMNWGHDPLKT